MNKETINSLTENNDEILKSLLLKMKFTCNKLNKEEIQILYDPKNYHSLSKHQKQQAIKANEIKLIFQWKFNAHVQKNLKHFVQTNLKIHYNIEQYNSFNLAVQKRTNNNGYGSVKNKIIWLLNHFINRNLSCLQIAYIVNCSVRYVQQIFHNLKKQLILYKYRLTKTEIQKNKAKYKNKYYLIKTFELSEANKNWLFADQKYWYFSNKEIQELLNEINVKSQHTNLEPLDFVKTEPDWK